MGSKQVRPEGSLPPDREIVFQFVKSSGPGGQNVNKIASKAVLRWHAASSPSLPADVRRRFFERFGSRITAAGEIVIACDRHRNRERNRDDCLERLRRMLAAVAVAPTPRKRTRPRRGAVERRLREKHARAERKQQRRSLD
ncbi:MAG TPA: alternative ribosome rescue aminoacyl-tRNA hydrolase ArfB [Casimicrobiaceae bacterium]|nr:alternative ribosome rescue aminoacyl-tRNA hydrolase ArfB [Casimicrobiaceae bacterium]